MNCKSIISKNKEGGAKRYKFVQTLLCPTLHKALRKLAVEQDVTLAELLQGIIESYFKKEARQCQKMKHQNQ